MFLPVSLCRSTVRNIKIRDKAIANSDLLSFLCRIVYFRMARNLRPYGFGRPLVLTNFPTQVELLSLQRDHLIVKGLR